MKKHLHHLHPRRPLFWVLVVLAIALAVWGLWPHALAAAPLDTAPGPAGVGLDDEARTGPHGRSMAALPLAPTKPWR